MAICSRRMIALALALSFASSTGLGTAYAATGSDRPGCEHIDAKQCVALALEAMGGRSALERIKDARLDALDHTEVMEQSYRQAPFLTAYDRIVTTADFAGGRLAEEQKTWWPENDPGAAAAESAALVVATPKSAIVRAGKQDAPGALSMIDDAQATLELGPERLLLTADSASDLHYEPAEMLRSTSHTVVAFRWRGRPVRVLINAANHLPDAMETTRTFNDFWAVWATWLNRSISTTGS